MLNYDETLEAETPCSLITVIYTLHCRPISVVHDKVNIL